MARTYIANDRFYGNSFFSVAKTRHSLWSMIYYYCEFKEEGLLRSYFRCAADRCGWFFGPLVTEEHCLPQHRSLADSNLFNAEQARPWHPSEDSGLPSEDRG